MNKNTEHEFGYVINTESFRIEIAYADKGIPFDMAKNVLLHFMSDKQVEAQRKIDSANRTISLMDEKIMDWKNATVDSVNKNWK